MGTHNDAATQARRQCQRIAVLFAAMLLVICAVCAPSRSAFAEQGPSPSVLIVDAAQGDYDTLSRFWLGSDVQEVAGDGTRLLVTAENPAWWGDATSAGGTTPATFLLGRSGSGHSVSAEDIVWALDQIRAVGAQPKTFIVAMGDAGLPVREYAEDLAATKQSTRADLVGIAFCGTAHNGYSIMATYPELTMWDTLAQTVGLSRDDLAPESAYLAQLNAGYFPRPVKVLNIVGTIGDLGFGLTDGAGVPADYVLPSSLSNQIQSVDAAATLGTGINLSGQWSMFTDKINHPDRLVDAGLVERISALEGYPTSREVQELVRNFYTTWFSSVLPVTHISNVLALDLSGSMFEDITPGNNKISGAKNAAREYLRAVQAYSILPQAAPADISTFGFSTYLEDITTGYDDAARNAIAAIDASHNDTNIGLALNTALDKLALSPALSDKRILLLSDGASTEGMSDDEMLAGPVAKARDAGIVIDTIGFGDVGGSNSEFLDKVASITGGTYYQVQDTYGLEVSFIRSYYSSLGLEFLDQELVDIPTTAAVGTLGPNCSALALGLVGDGLPPALQLLCDGVEVDPAAYEVQQEGNFVSVQYTNPPAGEYSILVSESGGAVHLFAVQQLGITSGAAPTGEQTDNSMLFLVGAIAVFAIGLGAVVARSVAKDRKQK